MKLGEGEVLLLVEKWLICGFWEISVVGGYFGGNESRRDTPRGT